MVFVRQQSSMCQRQPRANVVRYNLGRCAAKNGAFDTLGELHGNMQLYEWLRSLVATPAFADVTFGGLAVD
jgi:hypothetical protein